jgi:hypothetical protein
MTLHIHHAKHIGYAKKKKIFPCPKAWEERKRKEKER